MGVFENLGGMLGALANDDFDTAGERWGRAVDELFNSDSENKAPRARKWITTCKKCGFRFQQRQATMEPDPSGIYRCPDCGQKGPLKKPNGWSHS